MSNLPNEILRLIFKDVPTLTKLRLVCKQWKELLPIEQVSILIPNNSNSNNYNYHIKNIKQQQNIISIEIVDIRQCPVCEKMHDENQILDIIKFKSTQMGDSLDSNTNYGILKKLYLIGNREYIFKINGMNFSINLFHSSKVKIMHYNLVNIMWQDSTTIIDNWFNKNIFNKCISNLVNSAKDWYNNYDIYYLCIYQYCKRMFDLKFKKVEL